MSTLKRPPIKSRFVDNPVPKEYIDSENIAKMFSMLSQGNFGAFRDFLLEAKVNINILFEGMTPITEIIKSDKASENKKLELLKFLDSKLHVNTSDGTGLTPLHYAVKFGYSNIVKYLVDRKANIMTTADNGLTPLHYATLITLKECPKENMPQELIELDKTSKAKTSDVVTKMMDIFLSDGNNITVEGNNTELQIKDQFQEDVSNVKLLYTEIIKDIVTEEKLNKKLLALFSKGNVDKKEIIESFSKDIIADIKTRLKFPEKGDDIEELTDYNDATKRAELYKETIENIVQEVEEALGISLSDANIGETLKETEKYYKLISDEFSARVAELMTKHNVLLGTNIEYIRQTLANKKNMKTRYLTERYNSTFGDKNERVLGMAGKDITFTNAITITNADLAGPYDITLYTINGTKIENIDQLIPNIGMGAIIPLNTMTINDLDVFISAYTDKITFDQLTTYVRMINPYIPIANVVEKTLQTYFIYNDDRMSIDSEKIEETVFNLKIIESILTHHAIATPDKTDIVYNLGKNRISALLSQGLKPVIVYNTALTNPAIATFAYSDEITGKPFKPITENDIITDSLESLHIALRYPDQIDKRIIDYINRHFNDNIILKTMLLRVLLSHGVSNNKLVIESSDPYQPFLSAIENECYDSMLYGFDRPIVRENFDATDFETSMLTRIYRHEGFKENPSSFIIRGQGTVNIDNFTQNIVNSRSTNYYTWFIDSMTTFWKMEYGKNDNAVPVLVDYNNMDSNFTVDYNSIKDVDVVKDVLSTFYAFVITMFKRYLIDNIYYGPRAQNNGMDYTSRDIFDMIVTMMEKYNFQSVPAHTIGSINPKSMNEYISEFDDLAYNRGVSNMFDVAGMVAIDSAPQILQPIPSLTNLYPNLVTDAVDVNGLPLNDGNGFPMADGNGPYQILSAVPNPALVIDPQNNLPISHIYRNVEHTNVVYNHVNNNVAIPNANWDNTVGNWYVGNNAQTPAKVTNMNIFFNSIINAGIKYVYDKNSTQYTEETVRNTLKQNISRVSFKSSYDKIIDFAKYPDRPPYIPVIENLTDVITNNNVNVAFNGMNIDPAIAPQTITWQQATNWNAGIGAMTYPPMQQQITATDKKIVQYNKDIIKYNKTVTDFNNNYSKENYVTYVFEAMRSEMKKDIVLQMDDVTSIESNDGKVLINAGDHMKLYKDNVIYDNANNVTVNGVINPNYYTSLFHVEKKVNVIHKHNGNHVIIPQLSDMTTLDYRNLGNDQHELLITTNPQINTHKDYFNLILGMLLSLKNMIHYLYSQPVTTTNVTSFKNHYNAYHQISLLAHLYSLMDNGKSPTYLKMLSEQITKITNILPSVITTFVQTESAVYVTAITDILNAKRDKLKDVYNIVNDYNTQYKTFMTENAKFNNIITNTKTVSDKLLFADELSHLLRNDKLVQEIVYKEGNYFMNEINVEMPSSYFSKLNKFNVMKNEFISVGSDNNEIIEAVKTLQTPITHRNIVDFYKDISDNHPNHYNSIFPIMDENLFSALKRMYKSYYVTGDITSPMTYLPFPDKNLDDEPWNIAKIIDDNDLVEIASTIYAKVDNYNIIDDVLTKFPEIDLTDDRKKLILKDHMSKIYKQIVLTFMNNFIYNASVEQIKHEYDKTYIPHPTISTIILEPDDYRVSINSIKSKLKSHITTDNPALFAGHENVKLIEDEDYDIYAVENDVIVEKDVSTFVFYSYDYYNKQDDMRCIELNTGIINQLIKKGANIHASDMNGKTVIDYMIEARMYYLLDDNTIKKTCGKDQNVVAMSKYEEKHNTLFETLLQNHQTDFIRKIKLMDVIKQNIPINLRYIFMMYTVIQNFNWYKLMNKENNNNSVYNGSEKYVDYTGGNKLKDKYDWKKAMEQELTIDKTSKNEKKKIKKRLELNANYRNSNPDVTNKMDYDVATDSEIVAEIAGTAYNRVNDPRGNKVIGYLNEFASQYNDVPTNYTHIWKTMCSTIMDKPYVIHSVISREYKEALKNLETTNVATGILSNNNTTYDTEKIKNLKITCVKLDTIIEPMIKNINHRLLPKVYNENQLFKFQVQTYVHILSTFLGSHIFMSFKRILDLAVTETKLPITDDNLNDILEPLKTYVLSTKCEPNNLSYDFIKAHLNFQLDEEEVVEPKKTSDLFANLTSKFDRLDEFALNNNKIISKINSSMGSYYLALYQETLNALLNFSDGYLRFVKNQSLGIKFISKLA